MASNDIVELPSNFREAPSDLNDVTELQEDDDARRLWRFAEWSFSGRFNQDSGYEYL